MINKVILEGRLTRDPETRYSPSGTAVTRFNIAVDRRYVKQGEDRQTDFVGIVSFGKTAEFVSKWFVKGQGIAVVGNLQSRRWEDENGKTKYGMDVIAEEVHFAGKRPDDTGGLHEAYNNDVSDDYMPVGDDDLPF